MIAASILKGGLLMREVIVFNKDDICRLLSGAEINVKDSKGQIIRTYMSEERYNRDYSFNQNGYPDKEVK